MLVLLTDSNHPRLYNDSSSSSLCANGTHENCTIETTSSSNSSSTSSINIFPNSLVIIFVLSILSVFGVCFMIFGPLQRSEAYKRVENFTFGHHPIFNVDHREQSTATRYDDSMDFADI